MSRSTPTAREFDSLLHLAETEPIGLDISDYSDEWCAGFLAGQLSVLEEVLSGRLELPQQFEPPRISGEGTAANGPMPLEQKDNA